MKLNSRDLLDALLILAGILTAGMGLKGFLLSSHFIDGGVTGISMLASSFLGISLSLLIFLINLPFIVLAYQQMGPKFAVKSVLSIAGLAICLTILHYPNVTSDKLLTAVFGGICIGIGMALAIRGGAVLDGTEIAALLVSKHVQFLKVGDVILVLNLFIFSAAVFLLGTESALYSVLTYFAATKMVDFLLYGIEECHGITIVSQKNQEIRERLLHFHRGLTIYRGHGGLSHTDQEILYCVVTRLEVSKVKNIVTQLDPNAFIVVNSLSDVCGGRVKKNGWHTH